MSPNTLLERQHCSKETGDGTSNLTDADLKFLVKQIHVLTDLENKVLKALAAVNERMATKANQVILFMTPRQESAESPAYVTVNQLDESVPKPPKRGRSSRMAVDGHRTGIDSARK